MDTGEVQKRNCNAPCPHEEADTRLILHAAHVGKSEMKKVMIKTVDTDVVVLAISFFSECSLDELWVEFGSGKYHRYIPIHVLHKAFTEEQAQALIGFHAFTGCDQVSAFGRRGKKSAWNILKSLPSVTPVFQTLSSTPTCAQVEECFPEIKRFVVLLYDRSSECENTNRPVENFLLERIARLKLCLQHLPTSAALLQHTLMSALQGGFCWGQSLVAVPTMPSSSDYGWTRKGEQDPWSLLWTTLLPAAKSYMELINCGCSQEKGCRGRCKCIKADLPCTALYACDGLCDSIENAL